MKSIAEVHQPVSRPVRVLQFGEGNFLRAFVDWQIDIMNEKAGFNGNVAIVVPISKSFAADRLNAQKGLYTTILRGVQNGQPVVETRVIKSVKECLSLFDPAGFARYLELAASPDLRFVFSNTTEAGIAYAPGCALADQPPASYPAKMCQFLYRRFQAFKGDPAKGLIIITCELIDHNGDMLKKFVLQYAAEWKLEPAFTAWLEEACDFCSSLVDRIVPGYPRTEAADLCAKLGYQDDVLDAAEIFHLWVIESHKPAHSHEDELPFKKAGLNVVWTANLTPFRDRKVRILNGTHTMFVPAAFLAGFDVVRDCIQDPLMMSFIRKGLFEEIIPSIDFDRAELVKFANAVLERFDNPYIRHLLLSITLNSVSKFVARDLPSVKSYIAKFHKAPATLAFGLAGLIMFDKGTNPKDREMTGLRDGQPYSIQDDPAVLRFFAALHARTSDPVELAHAALSNAALWGEDLTRLPGFESAVASALDSIQKLGMKAAIQALVAQ